jgi:organic hydroperoxide reductase OsmC/OhrA
MAEHSARIRWERGDAPFTDNRYSRVHRVAFDGGAELRGSSSPHVVAPPMSDPAAVDPEEMFIAAIASCHMLWFLALAAAQGLRIDHYDDAAEGAMEKNAAGKMAITRVTLRPDVRFSGDKRPTVEEIARLHHRAHERCFIANSVTTEIRVLPREA